MASPQVDTGEYPSPPDPSAGQAANPIAPRIDVSLHAMSNTGKIRTNNEDIYLVARIERDFTSLMTNLPAGHVPDKFQDVCYGMIVADGMGGMEGGDVASRLAVSTLVNYALGTPDWIMRTGTWESQRIMERMAERYRNVNAEVIEQRASSPDLAGMATTMTVAFNVGAQLFVGHIGDSRAYLFRGTQLRQLTRDHTESQEMADVGLIRPESVAKHRLRHVLTRVLGRERAGDRADIQTLPLEDGDQVLLCTDGLTNMVDDMTIATVLGGDLGVPQTCEILIECALTNGGKDNVTVALARYHVPTGD
jgi:serine/threonine protein phosphatase PrpC